MKLFDQVQLWHLYLCNKITIDSSGLLHVYWIVSAPTKQAEQMI